MGKETVFKEGDRVYHLLYGWGVIKEHNSDENYSKIMFETGKEYGFLEHFLISFTEYTLQGFTQERPIVLPEVGELCLVRDCDEEDWKVVQFKRYNENARLKFIDSFRESWMQLKRIKILD
jgi:hypothetical protein